VRENVSVLYLHYRWFPNWNMFVKYFRVYGKLCYSHTNIE
jgi:hypothetical protein